MHIAVASHHRLPVKGYGGTERIVVALVRGLAALGHRVTLIAATGTKLDEARIVEVPPKALRDPKLDLSKFFPSDADVLHAHFLVRQLPSGGMPFLQTLYGNLKEGEAVPPHTVFLSRNHAARNRSAHFAYAGLDPQEFVFRDRKDDYDFFIGRLHSAKGYHWAIEGAKRTGRRLVLAGGWRPSFTGRIKYVGEVDGKEKAELLAGARCLWMPALWDEPFGLTTIEALFSGTPVLGTKRGALPEVLTSEVGALCDTLEDMIEASRTIHTRDARACRAHAQRWFTHVAMAEEYARLYKGLLETGDLPVGRATPYAPPPAGT
jgi:glycosyltransferase involved in cell wall biosynthesis